jgi:lipid-binding SYLF domain-containing protein
MNVRLANRLRPALHWVWLGALALAPVASANEKLAVSKEDQRVNDSATVFKQILESPDSNIPKQLMDQAKCVAIFPGMIKGALGWGAKLGRGVMSCRDASGHWGPPIFLRIAGGSWGLQIGVEKTDLLLFVMNDEGARSFEESEWTLGAKGAVAAGPVGRSGEAATDLRLDAQVYSYSRSKGLFAGLSLEGAKMSTDKEAMQKYYGPNVNTKAVLFDHQAPNVPSSAQSFMETLP